MTTAERLPAGYAEFARYAFPPNELGYCGPADASLLLRHGSAADLTAHAKEFDGAWPYLRAIADAAGRSDPLAEDVVRTYWVGGPLLDAVDPDALLHRLRRAFEGQMTGVLDALGPGEALAHHSFHVFAVYPWIGFLDRDPARPVQIMQDCRIRWGTVASVRDDHVVIESPPVLFTHGRLGLGDPVRERVRWRRDGASLAPPPVPGQTVSAHWDWVCATLRDDEADALRTATEVSLAVVNAARTRP